MNFDVESIKRKMLVKYPFFGSIVANVEYKENRSIPTAGTDGEVIYYNSDFLNKLSLDEQIFIFAHEVCHIAFNHILRSDGKDSQIWNIATDAVINAFLRRDGLKMVVGGVDIADAINYDAEQLYEKLLQEKQQKLNQNKQEQGSQTGSGSEHSKSTSTDSSQRNESGNSSQTSQSELTSGQSTGENSLRNNESEKESGDSKELTSELSSDKSSDGNQDVGHDTHSMWNDAVKKHKDKQNKSDKKEGILDKLFNKNKLNNKKEKSEVEKKQEEISEIGEKEAFNKNKEEKKKELKELKKTLVKEAMGAGTTTNSGYRNVTDIGYAKPLMDWRYILREAIKYDVDWSYKNAYIEDGVISANLEEQPIPETEILLDTSGSINEVLLKNFLRECKNILLHSKLKVGCFDTKFYGFHEIRTEKDIENMRFQGGGGTNFDVAVQSFSRRVENKIIFTDGDAHMPNMSLNAIWIVFGGIQINPKGGRVINITEEQLDRLYFYEQDNLYKGKTR